MFNEICKPYSFEKGFYKKNNIPEWECQSHQTKNIGRIYVAEDGSYVEAKVMPMPAQFWEFTIYCAESEKVYNVSTGSGGLENYFNTMKNIADGMIVVNSINPKP